MPTYEYKCLDCGKHFDVIQKMTDPHLETCKFCGGHVRRLIGEGAGIIFKGSGFYCTDYSHKTSVTSSKPSSQASAGASGK